MTFINCSTISDRAVEIQNCEINMALRQALHSSHLLAIHRLDVIIQQIDKMLPKFNLRPSNRRARFILDWIGNWVGGLFGFASSDELHKLEKVVVKLADDNTKIVDVWQREAEHIASYMRLNNNKLSLLTNTLNIQQHAINQLSTVIQGEAMQILTVVRALTDTITNLTHFSILQNEMIDFKDAIQELCNGILSPKLVSPDLLERTIKEISDHLRFSRPGHFLAHRKVNDYYTKHNFIFTRKDDFLFISVPFPVTTNPHEISMFKVSVYPLPVYGTHQQYTQIMGLPSYIAIATNLAPIDYLMFDIRPKLTQGNEYYLQTNHIPLTPIAYQTCVLALYLNNVTAIHILCKFEFKHDVIPIPQLLLYNHSHILLLNVEKFSIVCQQRSTAQSGCRMCIVSRKCGCEYATETSKIPARYEQCTSEHHETKSHVINLSLLHRFYTAEAMRLSSDTLTQHELVVEIPEMKIYSSNTSRNLAILEKQSFDLDRVANLTKRNQAIFQSLAHSIDHDMKQQTEDVTTQIYFNTQMWEPWAIVSSGLLTVLTTIGLLISLYKIKTLTVIVLTLQAVTKKADAQNSNQNDQTNDDNFPRYFTQSRSITTGQTLQNVTSTSQIFSQFIYTISIDTVIISLLLILLAVFIINVVGKRFLFRNYFDLYLEVSNSKQSCLLYLQRLPQSPNIYTFSAEQFIQSFSFTGSVVTQVTINWPSLTIYNSLNNTTYRFQDKHILTFLTSRYLKNIVHNPPYFCILLARLNTLSHQITLQHREPDEQTAHDEQTEETESSLTYHHTSTAALVSDETGNARLYPSLDIH